MTIGENAAVWFPGTQDDLASSSALVGAALGSFSIATDLAEWTNDDDATHVAITVEVTMAVTAANNSGVNIYFQLLDVVATSEDDSPPTGVYTKTFMGFFPISPGLTTSIQRSTIGPIALPFYQTSSKFAVWLENDTDEEIDAGWTVFVTPMSLGPHAA